MNITSLPLIAATVCTLLMGAVLYHLFPLDLDTGRDARQTRRLLQRDNSAQRQGLPFWRALLVPLYPLMQRVPGANLSATEQQLFWVQLDGRWTSWTAEEIWAVRIAGAALGIFIGLLQPPGITRLLPAVILFLLPGQMLSTAHEKVSRRVRRELPEFAQSIALQSSLGKSVDAALTEMLKADTVLSRFFGYALATQPSGAAAVPLLNIRPGNSTPGWLLQQAQAAGLKEVIGLVARLEKAARRGVEVDVLLGDIAELAASDYNAEVATRAQKLDSTLSVPMMIGLFLPYLVFLLAPFLQNFGELFK